jgi:hypothetical protein
MCGYSAVPHFFTLSEKQNDFRKKVLNVKCVFWFFCRTFVWNVSHCKKNPARYCHKRKESSCKVPFIVVGFKWNLNFLYRFLKNTQIFYEDLSIGSRVVACGRTDRQTDMTKLKVAFRSFANAPKNGVAKALKIGRMALRVLSFRRQDDMHLKRGLNTNLYLSETFCGLLFKIASNKWKPVNRTNK